MSMAEDDLKQTVGADLIIPTAASLYSIYYVASVWDFPAEAQRSGMFLAALLLGLSLLFFIRTAARALRGETRWNFWGFLGPATGRVARLIFLALTVVYIFVAPWGGFTLTTFGFLLASSWLAGLRPLRKALVFSAAGALGGWLFFIVLLGTRFPRGPFEHLIAMVAASWN